MILFDEQSHAGPEHLDPEYVARYDAKSQLDVQAQLNLLLEHGLKADSTLVDMGAGTGLLAAAAKPHCRRIVAVDPSPAMIKILQERGVEAVLAGFLTYEHEGEAPDVIYTRNALHHLPDFWKGEALRRIHCLLKPKGKLVLQDIIYDFEPAMAASRLEEWYEGAVNNPNEGWTRQELEEHVATEYSTYSWLFEEILKRTGFSVIDSSYRRGVYATYICRKD